MIRTSFIILKIKDFTKVTMFDRKDDTCCQTPTQTLDFNFKRRFQQSWSDSPFVDYVDGMPKWCYTTPKWLLTPWQPNHEGTWYFFWEKKRYMVFF